MFRKVSVVAFLLLSSVAFASFPHCPPDFKLQFQDFAIGAVNVVSLVGSGGEASGLNTVMILQDQHDKKICSGACQDELVLFVQAGNVVGRCGGSWNVTQEAIIAGSQLQLVGDGCGPKIQSQTLGVGLGQQVTKIDGTGTADAQQTLAVVQNQGAHNGAGMMGQSNVVLANQLASVSGGPCTGAQVTGILTVGTTQTQVDL